MQVHKAAPSNYSTGQTKKYNILYPATRDVPTVLLGLLRKVTDKVLKSPISDIYAEYGETEGEKTLLVLSLAKKWK